MAKTTEPPHLRNPRGRKPSILPGSLAARLRELRRQTGGTQEVVGAQGFISAPGWIKIENGQRSPSEKLLADFVAWLVREKLVRANAQADLLEELNALKYVEHRAPFLARLAKERLAALTPVGL